MSDLIYRNLKIPTGERGSPQSLDTEARSVEVVASTESPVRIFDFTRGPIDEVLLMDGLTLPDSGQVPLLDAHRRTSSRAVIGSFRDMRAEGGQLIGRAHFSETSGGRDAFQLVREGHLTDFSVGYLVEKAQFIPDGETQTVMGREFTGPVKVVTAWTLKELSTVPIGADDKAKARNFNIGVNEMPENIDNTENREDQIRAERERVSEILSMAEHFQFPKDKARELVDTGASVADAREKVMGWQMSQEPEGRGYRGPMTIQHDESEKREAAQVDSLVARAGFRQDSPAPGYNEYMTCGFLDHARECLQAKNERVRGLTKSELLQRAMTTSDFPKLLANSQNKSLRTAFQEYPKTYQLWTKMGSADDFKTMYRNALGASPSLEAVEEMEEYRYGAFDEQQESFKVGKVGKIYTLSWETIRNDDLNAFGQIPRLAAAAAARSVTSAVYGILTGNPNMSDGNSLFDSVNHSNLATGGDSAALAKATLGSSMKAMRLQTGLEGETLNISPQFLIIPAALEVDAMELLESTGNTANDKNEGVVNPFYRRLTPVIEAALDSDSSTAFYLAANPAQFDTVELAFLDGRDYPTFETREGWTVDRIEYKVRLVYGAKAIDWRGLYKNDGA